MFIARIVALILVILWLWPSSLHAQSEALMEASRRAQALCEAGLYEQAIPPTREVVDLTEQEFGPDHSYTAFWLYRLALLYQN